jgi:hypothetical protein
MKTYIFVCAKHEEYGSLGWKLKGKPHFEPFGGLTVAHDILEHFPSDDGTAGGECEALGASFHVRGCAYFQGIKDAHFSVGEQTCPDIARLFRDQVEMPKCASVKKLDNETEEELAKAYKGAVEDLKESEIDESEASTFLQNAINWMRIGYRKAVKRYKHNTCELAHFFHKIETLVDRAGTEEGQEMTISVDIKTLTVRCFVDYPQDMYAE